MDQYASLLCEAGSALLIDCRSLEAEPVPLDLEGAGLSLVVCDTRVERGLADTGYNERRTACERAAETSGVEALRDATEGDLEAPLRRGAAARPARRHGERPRDPGRRVPASQGLRGLRTPDVRLPRLHARRLRDLHPRARRLRRDGAGATAPPAPGSRARASAAAPSP